MQKRKFFLLCAFGVLTVIVAVLLSSILEKPGIENNSEGGSVVGVVVTPTEDDWSLELQNTIIKTIEDAGYTVMEAQARRDNEAQIEAVRSLIVFQVDAIIVSPILESGWNNALLDARSAKIPVICLSRNIRPARGEVSANYVGYDYYSAAYQLMEMFLDENTLEEAVIVELHGKRGCCTSKELSRGIHEALNADGRFSVKYRINGDLMQTRGRESIAGLIAINPDVNVIISYNDAMTIGAVLAVEQAGLSPGEEVLIYSVGGGDEVKTLLKEGKINGIAELDLNKIGNILVDTVQDLCKEDSNSEISRLAEIMIRTGKEAL